jgi:hypothetical protein
MPSLGYAIDNTRLGRISAINAVSGLVSIQLLDTQGQLTSIIVTDIPVLNPKDTTSDPIEPKIGNLILVIGKKKDFVGVQVGAGGELPDIVSLRYKTIKISISPDQWQINGDEFDYLVGNLKIDTNYEPMIGLPVPTSRENEKAYSTARILITKPVTSDSITMSCIKLPVENITISISYFEPIS